MILLVEDEFAHAFLITSALKQHGLNVLHVSNVDDAEEYLRHNKDVTLIVSDLNLEETKGVETVNFFRTSQPDLPLIVLTASTALSDAVEAMRGGAEDFVIKTFDQHFSEVLIHSINRCISRQETLREQYRIQREMDSLKIAIGTSPDGIAVLTGSGQYRYMNPAFESFIQKCGGDCLSIYSIVGSVITDAKDIAKKLDDFFLSKGSPGVVHFGVTLSRDLDEVYDISLSSSQAGGAGGKLKGQWIAWVRDVSAQKKRERIQRELLSTITHDLKGPLGAISLSSEMISKTSDISKIHDFALRVQSISANCSNLINEFLSARKLQDGAYVFTPKECKVNELVLDVVREFEPVAQARSIEMNYSENASEVLWTIDPSALRRVVSNLVSNAVKYTGKGGRISLCCEVLECSMRISVSDSGRGIDPMEVNRIFERYSRLEVDSSRQGHGLGLYIVKNIMDGLQGKIEVTSALGVGSKFMLIFPNNTVSEPRESI